uniref:Uncharacterized protein n=1 Tax=Biomphalaria glabrata TaxID=6526 RepID=A0A2C9KMW6_BIOGL
MGGSKKVEYPPRKSFATSEAQNKAFAQNRATKGEALLFVRRNQIIDEKKAIFIRIQNIAFSTSANNETVRELKKTVSLPASRVSTPSTPGTPKRMRAPAAKMGKRPASNSYLNILVRNKKSSFASLVDHYAQLDNNEDKTKSKRNITLEEELRQIDTFFANLGKKKDAATSKGKAQEDNKKVARLWKDLGYTVVKSENRPSIYEISSPTQSQLKTNSLDRQLKDIRKSYVEMTKPEGSTSNQHSVDNNKTLQSNSQISVEWTSLTTSNQDFATNTAKSNVPINTRAVLKWSVTQDGSSKKNPPGVSDEESKPTSRLRKSYERLKSFFSRKKDSSPSPRPEDGKTLSQALYISKTNSDKNDETSTNSTTQAVIDENRHVKWSDGNTPSQSNKKSPQEHAKKAK